MKYIDFLNAKNALITALGAIGGIFASAFGGWSTGLTTLVIFMAVDYITGLVVAGVFHKSKKTEGGTLESRAGFKGICKKVMMLLCVLVGYRLDLTAGTTVVKDGITIAFLCNEALSIVENAGLMGVPIPQVILNSIEVLKNNGENNKNAFR